MQCVGLTNAVPAAPRASVLSKSSVQAAPCLARDVMPASPEEIKRREAAARAAIKRAYGTAADEFDVALFVSHHLEELDAAYWRKHFATDRPDPFLILDALVLRSHWGGDDEIDKFDFTLPGEATNYVVSVGFDEKGEISEISMES